MSRIRKKTLQKQNFSYLQLGRPNNSIMLILLYNLFDKPLISLNDIKPLIDRLREYKNSSKTALFDLNYNQPQMITLHVRNFTCHDG